MTWLYRTFDINDELLYVGITEHLHRRLRQHQSRSSWWAEVERVGATRHENRAEAREAELTAIATELPIHNIADHPGFEGYWRDLGVQPIPAWTGDPL